MSKLKRKNTSEVEGAQSCSGANGGYTEISGKDTDTESLGFETRDKVSHERLSKRRKSKISLNFFSQVLGMHPAINLLIYYLQKMQLKEKILWRSLRAAYHRNLLSVSF